ncbi:uncharacterized protein F5891DRAFT_1189777 [Suillus fuscotomentosus]|uniref:Uncharacterized protein n=1 Tax=Suillus fuscotomentosus TaxID=1912939 RepID=A0AAD4HJX6_9AGAM|nr:uncharacterized protein F5891DRAFT_1189777 [Suillus fuscotomentosus]KAG1899338.1 hypothetical protein F5891DRAFT_1189777 [Suillus fuscotomentosus]
MQHKLQPYRPKDSLQFHKIIFNIETDEKAEHHAESMEILMGRLKLQEYEHIEIFIYTHSEIEWGDIWGGFEDDEFVGRRRTKVAIQGEPVIYAIDVFFAGLFVGGIEEYVRGATLWVLICGHMVRQPNSFKLLQTCVKKYEVEHVFAFDAVLFHVCLTIPLSSSMFVVCSLKGMPLPHNALINHTHTQHNRLSPLLSHPDRTPSRSNANPNDYGFDDCVDIHVFSRQQLPIWEHPALPVFALQVRAFMEACCL